MNNISLVTFAAQTVTPQDDALVYESALGAGGIIYGGEVTVKNANTLHMNAGHGVICGRKFTIFDSDIPVTLSSSGDLLGRLYIHLDLSNASDPIEVLVETGQTLSPLVQDEDVNIVNGIYDMNIASFNVSTSAISDLRNVYPKIAYANSGSLITITTQESSLIGEEVTITDGTDYVYAVFNADGVAELTNVLMTGTLQVSATNGTDIASSSISVPYYGSYELELAFWNATLYMTTPNSELHGQTITFKNSSDETVGTTTFGGSGTATYIVKEPDTYTASVSYGGRTYSASVVVTTQTTYSIEISLELSLGVTVYSAPNDTISYVGIDGQTHTISTDSYGEATTTIQISSNGSSITFTSIVAKDTNNLSNDYSKTVSLTSATTEIYVMPENAIYWWGYKGSLYSKKTLRVNAMTATITENTNALYFAGTEATSGYGGTGISLTDNINLSSFNALNHICQRTPGSSTAFNVIDLFTGVTNGEITAVTNGGEPTPAFEVRDTLPADTSNALVKRSVNISTVSSGNVGISFMVNVTLEEWTYALWLE